MQADYTKGIGRGRGGRRELTESDRELLKKIRQYETLQHKAHEARDQAIVEAARLGINYEIIGAAAGGIKQHTVVHIVKYPFDAVTGPYYQRPGRKRRRT